MPTTATPRVDEEFVEGRDALEGFEGESTLDAAQSALGFSIPLPSYPDGIGLPDRVFLNNFGTGEFAVLYWLGDEGNLQADMLLYVLGPDTLLTKAPPTVLTSVEVNGQQAVLAMGKYLLFATATGDEVREVEGPVLIWQDGELSYRLEVDLPLEEMIRIAESLQ